VVNVHLPDASGIELCRLFMEQNSRARVLVLSSFDWDVYLAAAWSAGAAGFRSMGEPTHALVSAIREVATGRIYTSQQLGRIEAWDRVVGERLQTLRLREWEVLRRVAAGQSNHDISQDLSLSENTVEKYLTSLHQKLRVSSRTGLLALFLRYNLDHIEGLVPISEIRQPMVADFRSKEMAEIRSDTGGNGD
jgi:DNA-binding NarL/FixJ family response regulator